MTTRVGTVVLRNPVMTASGTAGHGAELAGHMRLDQLGAVVVKSLSASAWDGNPPPRMRGVAGGLLNSVGLQNPGVDAWLRDELPALVDTGARVVASIWGFTVEDYEKAALAMAAAPDEVIAVEVNLSCPNIEARRDMFAHNPDSTAAAVSAAARSDRPLWAKLSPNVTDITEIAGAALEAGAEAITAINTVMGLAIDVTTRRPMLGGGGGGLSGRPVHPIAVRAVADCRAAFPDAAIVGVGGIDSGESAVEMLLAGASAVQVGTATFADPRAPARVLTELEGWCRRHGVRTVNELIGAVHA